MISVTLVLLVIAAAHWRVQEASRQKSAQRLHIVIQDVIRRIQATRDQRARAFARLESEPQGEACAPAHLRRMRKAIADASYLQGIGVVEGNLLRCVTLTDLEAPVDLGPARHEPGSGLRNWPSVHLSELPDTHFNVNALGSYATLTVPETVLDVEPHDAALSIAQLGLDRTPPVVIRQHGAFDPAWLDGFAGKDATVLRGDHLIVIQVIQQWRSAIVAAMPAPLLKEQEQIAWDNVLPAASALALLLLGLVGVVLQRRLSMLSAITAGLAGNEFYVLYQPVIDLHSGRCVGAEALVRWCHDGQQVSPNEFIPMAEKSRLICQITDSVLGIVAGDARSLVDLVPDAHIGINLSARDIERPRIPPRLLELTRKAGIAPHNIMIEVTEYGLLSPDHAADILASTRELGFRVAVDDFGTGHSSLSYLANYKLDYLKIDKSFVNVIDAGDKASALVYHIIDIARSLGLEIIAEGVETQRQREVLLAAGVRFAQGWLFGKPMPIAQLLQLAGSSANPPPASDQSTAS